MPVVKLEMAYFRGREGAIERRCIAFRIIGSHELAENYYEYVGAGFDLPRSLIASLSVCVVLHHRHTLSQAQILRVAQ